MASESLTPFMGYFKPEEREFIAAGERMPIAKRNLDRLVLGRVTRAAFPDIFKAYIAMGDTSYIIDEIAGRELAVGRCVIPMNEYWDTTVNFGFPLREDRNDAVGSFGDLVAVGTELSTNTDTSVGDSLDDELYELNLVTRQDFELSTGEITGLDIWTPYNTEVSPLELAAFVAELHRPYKQIN